MGLSLLYGAYGKGFKWMRNWEVHDVVVSELPKVQYFYVSSTTSLKLMSTAPWPLNWSFHACILCILETHAHKGRHVTINIVTYRSTRVSHLGFPHQPTNLKTIHCQVQQWCHIRHILRMSPLQEQCHKDPCETGFPICIIIEASYQKVSGSEGSSPDGSRNT